MQARDFNFTKKRHQHRCFPTKFAKFLRAPILKNICKRLLSSSSFSSFKLDLVDLNVFPDLDLRLAKIKPFREVCISKFSVSVATLLLSYVIKFENYQILFFHSFSMNWRQK